MLTDGRACFDQESVPIGEPEYQNMEQLVGLSTRIWRNRALRHIENLLFRPKSNDVITFSQSKGLLAKINEDRT